MKKQLLTLAFIALSAIFSNSQAQVQRQQHRTWVMEFNRKQPNVKIIKFYDDEQKLIYSETLYGQLDISRRKVQKKLNTVLDALIKGLDTTKNSNILLSVLNSHMQLE